MQINRKSLLASLLLALAVSADPLRMTSYRKHMDLNSLRQAATILKKIQVEEPSSVVEIETMTTVEQNVAEL